MKYEETASGISVEERTPVEQALKIYLLKRKSGQSSMTWKVRKRLKKLKETGLLQKT